MQNDARFILALQLSEPERFREIFGDAIAQLAQEDIARGLELLCASLLQRYQRHGAVMSPRFGLWYLLFAPKPALMAIDMEEQMAVLKEAGEAKVRDLFRDSFGQATGRRQNFSLAIFEAPQDHGEAIIPAIEQALRATPAACHAGASREALCAVIAEGVLETYFQPIVALADGKIVGYEALSRGPLQSPLRDADALFSAARYFGLAQELEFACLKQALNWLPRVPEPLWIAVNLGPDLFAGAEFQDYLTHSPLRSMLPRVVFELTEHLPVASAAKIHAVTSGLQPDGLRLSLDDTGCGFFDLSTVAELRPEIVKLCITVISRIGRNPAVEQEMRATVAEISRLGGRVLGEGVEHADQAAVLKQCGAILAQGNYFGLPRPAVEIFPTR